jgi:hypothetical protein
MLMLGGFVVSMVLVLGEVGVGPFLLLRLGRACKI